ncbi:MAG: peroxiredoxin family protein [Kiritimatiellia bacterium]|jgi:peroxiredoxin family protein
MSFPFQQQANLTQDKPQRHVALICAKAGLDESYPVLIMANAARMTGIKVSVFFTFYGLDVITKNRVNHLHVNMVGNPASPIPPLVAGLPGMESLATSFMQKKMDELDLPRPAEMLDILAESGADLYACELAMNMFGRTKDDLVSQVHSVITATDFFELTDGADIVFV